MNQIQKRLMPISTLPAHLQQKDWARTLVAASGKPLAPHAIMNVREPDQEQGRELTRQVEIVIDCSNSMSRKDKMQQARRGALQFAREAQGKGYLVGLIGFASDAEILLEPTESLEGIRQGLGQMKAGRGSTNMADGIQTARELLADERGEKVMCIVTDGQPDDDELALAEAAKAKQLGIEIMTIGTDDADRAFLERIASRHELSAKVESHELEKEMVNMAKMLPMLPAPKRDMSLRLPRL